MLHAPAEIVEIEDPLRLFFEDDLEPHEDPRPKRFRLVHAESMESFVALETQLGLELEQLRLGSHLVVGLPRDRWTVVRSAMSVGVLKGFPMFRERRSFPPLNGSHESAPWAFARHSHQLLLHHVWGFSFGEIGAMLGIREGTAKLRAYRAINTLREMLSRETASEGGTHDSR